MYTGNDDYSYADCDDTYSETDGYDEDEYDNDNDDDDCFTLNYDEFVNRQNKSPQWSPTEETPDEDFDFDERISPRQDYHYEEYVSGSTSKSAVRGEHSCLKLKDGYCYLDPRVYDTRVMRNLTTMDDNRLLPKNYSPKLIQAALEKTESLTSWSDDTQVNDTMYYDDQELENLDEDYDDNYYPQTKRPVQGAELEAMVESLIYNTQVVIFSKTYCPYCVTAKEIFDDLDQPYTVIELDKRFDGDQIQEIMGKITGGTSVPRIFVNGIFIGGGDDLKNLYETGELQDMLDIE